MALGWRGQYLRYREFFLNIMLLYRSRRDLKMFLEIILSLTTIIVFLLFALKPTALTIIALFREINEKEEAVSSLDKKIANLESARTVYSEETALLPAVESAIPNQPQPEVFVKQIEGIANKNSVKVLGASVGEITLVGKVDQTKKKSSDLKALPSGSKEMSISLSVNGSYPGIMSFARDLENSRRPIKIDSFGINVSTTETGRQLVAIISGRVPFLGQ